MAKATEIHVPDIGGSTEVEVIEILVGPGDTVKKEDSIITLESDKATMEIPVPNAGVVKELKIKVGDKVSEGDLILLLETASNEEAVAPAAATVPEKAAEKPASSVKPQAAEPTKVLAPAVDDQPEVVTPLTQIHAGPGVRRFARELGVELTQVVGSGRKGRVLQNDVQTFVKGRIQGGGGSGLNVTTAPVIDFSKFGEVEVRPLNKIKKLTGVNVHRSWVTVPHVTQFDEADITAMDLFRKSQKADAEKQGVKLTPLAFIMKAVVAAMREYPTFNSSLDHTGENLILKKYFHIGVAVETPNGLVVPVIKDVDTKRVVDLARELGEISTKAREKGLMPTEMAGSCFTISSLGGIGGTAFTPIVKAPDVAILGVSKAQIKPVYQDGEFVPRLMLPISLSYDHRVIDGAEGARFTRYLSECLSDIRRLLL